MSKVHEALKRAQEERSLVATQVENQNCTHGIKAPSAIVTPVPPSPIVLTSASVLIAPVFAPPALEHRPQAPAVGRDPRTGQFLRFEDLLKSCAKPAWVLDPRTVVFCGSNGPVEGTEQFRTLRTRLYNLRETSPLKRVLVTSAVAAEGKTFVATNLAQAIGRERDRRVLLIDADLRSPSLHLPLAAPLSPGLSDYLRDQASDADIIQHGQEGNLCFIAAGSGEINPSELLSNGSFEKLLDRLTPLFDWVIIDSPPCLPVADANVLAGLCDGVLLVVRAKSTPASAAERARKELQKRKVVGVVMNAVEEADTYAAYY
jgi:protein-tyrosine kinase